MMSCGFFLFSRLQIDQLLPLEAFFSVKNIEKQPERIKTGNEQTGNNGDQSDSRTGHG